MNKTVNIIVVTYNRKKMLKECLENLLTSNHKKINIFIIDNCSNDDTYEYVQSFLQYDNIYYYKTPSNIGGAGGFNYGLKKAIKINCDYFWLMDDDCIVNNNTLDSLINFADSINDDFGFLSSRVNWIDGTICKMNVQKISLTKKVKDFEKNQKIAFATFVSFFIKKSVILDIGLPIKEFFIWGDDIEYSKRISSSYNCYYVANSIVTHKSLNNFGSNIINDDKNLNRYFYAYRNEQYLFKKFGLIYKAYFMLKKINTKVRIIKSKCNNKSEKIKLIDNAVKNGKSFNPIIEFIHDYNKEINVLLFFCEPLLYGGQESFMINMYKNFKNNKIHYTFATPFEYNNAILDQLISNRNDKVLYNDNNFHDKSRKKYIKNFAKEIINSKYDTIHIQTGSLYAMLEVAKIAKTKGVKKIIVHSHCTGYNNVKYKIIKKICDKNLHKYANVFLGCGELACSWKYNNNIIQNRYFHVIKNGLDVSKFKFNSEIRTEYRKKFNITDELTILHIGRFEEQKNHKFIVQIANKLSSIGVNYKLILVGDGPLKKEIIFSLQKLNLIKNFIILEKRNDVSNLMMAADMFILPSLFEGLAITSIESQATGLYTLCSDNITKECAITDLVQFLPLNDDIWVKTMTSLLINKYDRVSYNELVSENGYDAKKSSCELEEIYYGVL